MSLAIVTEVANRFRSAVAKWNKDSEATFESRFLLKDGIYVGNFFRLGQFEGRWMSEDNSLKIYRGSQWLMTIPLEIEIETVESKVPTANKTERKNVA